MYVLLIVSLLISHLSEIVFEAFFIPVKKRRENEINNHVAIEEKEIQSIIPRYIIIIQQPKVVHFFLIIYIKLLLKVT